MVRGDVRGLSAILIQIAFTALIFCSTEGVLKKTNNGFTAIVKIARVCPLDHIFSLMMFNFLISGVSFVRR
jgi:hypothetical protein